MYVHALVKGQAPLHIAALYAADSIVQLLQQRGAVANARNDCGCTPLMLASSLPVVKLLLAAGADATAVNSAGMTVLQYRAKHGACAGTVCLLLKAGADPTATVLAEGGHVTAAHIAGINGHFALEALLSRAADDYSKQHSTINSTVEENSSNSGSSGSSSSSSGVSASAQHGSSVQAAAAAATGSSTAFTTSTPISSDAHGASTATTADTADDTHIGSNNKCTTDDNDACLQQLSSSSSNSSSNREKLVNRSSHVLTAASLLVSYADVVQLCTTAV
jgi:Ankyrin repeats (3 copies)